MVELVKNLPPVRIWPIYKEDYGAQYGEKRLSISYQGKKVLDVGADVGSTADFFLRRGAQLVIAVEGNKNYYEKLLENARKVPGIKPVFLYIKDPSHFADLIKNYRPDVLKADCEGCEKHLNMVPEKVFIMVPEYLVETHSPAIEAALLEKWQRCGYTVRDVNKWRKTVSIIYATKP